MPADAQDIYSINNINYIIERTAPHLRTLELSIFAKRSNNRLFSGEESAHYEELLKPIRQRRLELTNDLIQNPEKFYLLFKEEKAKEQEEIRLKNEQEEQERFYNQPEANAEISYWAVLEYWSLDEAAALCLGKDPKKVNWGTMLPLIPNSAFAKQYEKIREICLRARAADKFSDKIIPKFFLEFAKQKSLPFPVQLEKIISVNAIKEKINDKEYKKLEKILEEHKTRSENTIGQLQKDLVAKTAMIAELQNKTFSPAIELNQKINSSPLKRKINNLAKLLYCIAVDKFSHKPGNEMATAKKIETIVLGEKLEGLKKQSLVNYLRQGKTIQEYLLEGHEQFQESIKDKIN